MQVKLRTESLGPIDVRTIVRGNDIGASIRVEARETQMMMSNEISRLEQALSERSLRVQRLDVLQGSVSGGQSSGTGPGSYQGNPSRSRQGSASYTGDGTYPTLPETPPVYEEGSLGLSTTRINLRA
jgi:flagellar hook-length control protein FliK